MSGQHLRLVTDHTALEERRASLHERLEASYARIERGLASADRVPAAAGGEVTRWEDLWLALLNEYEAVCADLERQL